MDAAAADGDVQRCLPAVVCQRLGRAALDEHLRDLVVLEQHAVV